MMERERGVLEGDRIKIITVTAVDDSKNIMEAFQHGKCEAYLTKPLERNKRISHIRDLGIIE